MKLAGHVARVAASRDISVGRSKGTLLLCETRLNYDEEGSERKVCNKLD